MCRRFFRPDLGQSAGTALASILFGDANPSGHLPCTFDRAIEENAAYLEYPGKFPEGGEKPVVNYREGIFYGYRGYDRSGRAPSSRSDTASPTRHSPSPE